MDASTSVGPQPGLAPQQFLPVMAPVHLPTLASTNGADTPHLPIGHHAAALEVPGINDTLPLRTGTDFGSQDEYPYLSNTNEILTSATLCVQLDALTASGGGSNPRYVDDILCAAIDKIEWLYGSTNSVCTISGDELHFSTMMETGDIELDKQLHLRAAGLSDEERATLARSAQEVRLKIPFYWSEKNAGHWHSYALGRPLKVRITWRSPEFLLQQDTVNMRPTPTNGTTYITKKWIHFETSIPTEATKQVYMSKIEQFGDSGWLQICKDVQTQTFQLTSGTSSQLRTDMFTKYGHNLRFIVRPAANLLPNYLNNNPWKTVKIVAAQFDISNKIYFPKTSDYDLKHDINSKYFAGNHELNIYNIPLCSQPALYTQAMGGIEFSNTSLPVLKLWTDVDAAATPLTVTCWLMCHNYVRTVIRGVNSAIETVLPLQ